MSFKTELRDFLYGFFDNPGNFQGGFGLLAPSDTGIVVDEVTSMQVGAVAACQRIISSAVASMGCYVYERMPNGGHKLATSHPLFETLSLRPNPDYPAVDFFSAGQVNLLQNGNGYAEIQHTNGGQVQLLLRSPFQTHVYRDQLTGALTYKTTDTPTGTEKTITAENMVHVRGMGVNAYTGLSPIRFYMREVLGVALAAQSYGAKLFRNDSRPGGYLKSPNPVKPADKLTQIQSWITSHSGRGQHTPAYLDGGVEWANVGINPDEAQFLQTRQFQRSEIASIYGVPAHMIGDPTETKATIEQKALEFLLWTVKIWLRRWEHALNVKLLPTTGRNAGRFFIKFDTSEFERADYATMLKGIQTGRYAGLYDTDEGRKLLGLNPATAENYGMTEAEFQEKQPSKKLWQPVNMAIATGDPLAVAAPGATSAGDDGAAPAEDQPAPSDDGGDDSRSFFRLVGHFEARLDQIAGYSKPNLAAWEKVFLPTFEAIAGEKSEMVSRVARGFLASMHRAGADACRKQTEQIIRDFKAMVRATTTPHGGSMRVERRFVKGAEVKALPSGSGDAPKIEGYAAVFNEFYVLYEDPGFQVRETILPGAFLPVMQDDVRCLFNHDADNVLGRTASGTLVLAADDKGLAYINLMDETRIGKDVYAFVKRGDVSGCSFAFIVRKASWDEEELDGGVTRWTRKIEEMEQLFDVGPVTYPAYEQTTVDARELRSADTIPEEIMQRIKAGKPARTLRDTNPVFVAHTESLT